MQSRYLFPEMPAPFHHQSLVPDARTSHLYSVQHQKYLKYLYPPVPPLHPLLHHLQAAPSPNGRAIRLSRPIRPTRRRLFIHTAQSTSRILLVPRLRLSRHRVSVSDMLYAVTMAQPGPSPHEACGTMPCDQQSEIQVFCPIDCVVLRRCDPKGRPNRDSGSQYLLVVQEHLPTPGRSPTSTSAVGRMTRNITLVSLLTPRGCCPTA
jgi:hypothetical protein